MGQNVAVVGDAAWSTPVVPFTGQAELIIDAKGRLAIPAKYRSLIDPTRDGSAWYVGPWPVGMLRLYTERRFEAMCQAMGMTLMPDTESANRQANYFSEMERLEMDSAGRINLPKSMLELAEIPSPEVMLIGAGDRLEVRDRAAFLATRKERFLNLPGQVRPG